MGKCDTQLEDGIARALRLNKKVGQKLEFMQEKASRKQYQDVYDAGFETVDSVEKLALLCRSLPCYTGHPKAKQEVEMLLGTTVPVEMGYTEQGWFLLRMPILLPKKEKGSPEYVRGFLYPAMRRFFNETDSKWFDPCVLIFRHIYDQTRPEREYRDHDNIELNAVVDAVALRSMADDKALRCRHFYCSAPGLKDCTEVYVVPKEEFPSWFAMEPNFPKSGLEIIVAAPNGSRKDMEKQVIQFVV